MLNKEDLKEYRMRSGLSVRDVASYCDISYQLVSMLEQGVKDLTEFNYKEFVRGVNGAKQAKKDGTFKQIDKTVQSATTTDSAEKKAKVNTVAKGKKTSK